jgi:hypothetical protein
MFLHESIKRFYLKIISLFGIEVLSNTGWIKADKIGITKETEIIIVKTKHFTLNCAPDHILIESNGSEIFAKDSLNKEICTVKGPEEVIEIIETHRKEKLYDLSLIGDNHLYFTNGILSHNCVICDEFAFLQKNLANNLFTSMFPVIASFKDGKFIIVSTPNGTDNLYYDIWQKANDKSNKEGWKPFEMYWWQVPGHDENWKKKQIAAIGAERFAQEFNNEFIGTNGDLKLIPNDIISKFKIRAQEAKIKDVFNGKLMTIPDESGHKSFEFTMWHEFDPKRAYASAADVSEGVGEDSSVLYIADVTDLGNIKLCAKFSSAKISPIEFAYISTKILALYNNPPFIAERNGVGAAYLDSMRITYGYTNLVREAKDNEVGVRSHNTVKGRACLNLKDMMTTDGYDWTLYDDDLIDDMKNFVKKDSKLAFTYSGMGTHHDDHIMALVWLAWLLNSEIIHKYFIVVDTFVSSFGVLLPKTLQPLNDPTSAETYAIYSDPIYKDFLKYKAEIEAKFIKMVNADNEKSGLFNPFNNDYSGRINQNNRFYEKTGGFGKPCFINKSGDIGYGFDDCWGGGSW